MTDATNEDVARAIENYCGWRASATPSARNPPRVMVQFSGMRAVRRPFKLKGFWRVRWAGTARLTNLREEDGLLIFTADYGRPE